MSYDAFTSKVLFFKKTLRVKFISALIKGVTFPGFSMSSRSNTVYLRLGRI
jgi:hypothetical protein